MPRTWDISESPLIVGSDIDEFIHKHTLLISVAQASSEAPAQWSLSHWHHHSPGASLVITTSFAVDDLRHVAAFRELCVLLIPSSLSSPRDWNPLLSSFTATAHIETERDADGCKSNVQHVIAQMQKSMPVGGPPSSSQELTSLNLYSIETRTRAENGLEDGDTDEMVWKWAKPASPYVTSGFWCATAEEAVTDGAWSAGRGFLLLAEKVGKWKKKVMFEGGRKPMTILSNKAFEKRRFLTDSEARS